MMLDHIGFPDRGKKLAMALEVCGQYEKKLVMTGRDTGATGPEFANYILATMQDPDLESRWQKASGVAA
jgi:isocitrate dehydrogenase (NAD+)